MRKFPALVMLMFLTACGSRENQVAFDKPETLPSLQAVVSNETPLVGEPVDVQLRISAENRLVLPPIEDWLDPTIEVLDSNSSISDTSDLWIKEQNLKVALFQVTNVTLFAEAKGLTLDTEPQELSLPFKTISVQSVLTGEDDAPRLGNDTLPDFRGPEALKRQRRNFWLALLAGLIVISGLAVIWWLTSRKPRIAPPPVPPHVKALRRIRELKESEIWKRRNIDACAVELSFILRRYIEERFDIHAPGQTTEEFFEQIEKDSPWPKTEQPELNRFFDVTDRIKFAAARPDAAVLEELLVATREFVENTKATSEATEESS